jgi:quinol monooxygenase YgiN
MPEYTTFKRWALLDGHTEAELVSLVQSAIIPHYRLLPGCKRLGLLRIPGTRSYLATQHWQDREAYEQALASASYPAWLAAYAPALEQWHQLMALKAEWETETIL